VGKGGVGLRVGCSLLFVEVTAVGGVAADMIEIDQD
jgi:hypothetical protein